MTAHTSLRHTLPVRSGTTHKTCLVGASWLAAPNEALEQIRTAL